MSGGLIFSVTTYSCIHNSKGHLNFGPGLCMLFGTSHVGLLAPYRRFYFVLTFFLWMEGGGWGRGVRSPP